MARHMPGHFSMDNTHRSWRPADGLLFRTLTVLLILSLTACSKSPEELKAEQAKIEAETTGSLVLKSNRPNTTFEVTRVVAAGEPAAAILKGNEEGAAEQTFARLLPGKYSVIARSEGWADLRTEGTVAIGGTAEVAIRFPSGSLRLDTVPTGAIVKQGRTQLGKTPLVIAQLPVGEAKLSLEFPAWPPVPYTAAITENQEATATVRLPHGRLTVDSVPAGASVVLGGKVYNKTPLYFDPIAAGPKKLTLQMKDFPPLEVEATVIDGQEVRIRPVLGTVFPVLDPAELLRDVWIPDDPGKVTTGFNSTTGIYRPKNDIVKNIHREGLYNRWQRKVYRYSGAIKTYDPATGRVEFAEQKSELARYRVVAQVRPVTTPGAAAQKAGTLALYGRLTAVEEPSWPARVITFELSDADLLPEGTQ